MLSGQWTLRRFLFVSSVILAGLVVAGSVFALMQPSVEPSEPSSAPLQSDLSNGMLPVEREGQTLDLSYCSNADPQQASTAVRTVVLAMHGSERNACDYAGYAVDAASGSGVLDSTLVVAPLFAAADDLSADDSSTLYWEDSTDGWRSGDQSLTEPLSRPWTISSYAALDEMVATVDDTTKFPNLTRVVIAGHSAGGQVVQRYSLGTTGVTGPNTVALRYVVMNPSSYMYLTDERFTNGAFEVPTNEQIAQCPDYDQYKYGMQGRNEYMSTVDADAMLQRFESRDIVYLLGESDTDPNDSSMDTSCEAEFQGSQRFERGTNYYQSLVNVIGPSIRQHQTLDTVPDVGHDGHDMFDSQQGQLALFGN